MNPIPFLCLRFALAICLLLASCVLPGDDWRDQPVSYSKEGLWNKPELTWRLNTLTPIPPPLDPSVVRQEIQKSFDVWEEGDVFRFAQAADGENADIVISFTSPPDRPFDGRLGRFGTATFPWSPNRGRIYLDPSEWWTTRSFAFLREPITDWLPHEIGHTLGLLHMNTGGYTMSTTGPFGMPDRAAFTQLRHLYHPDVQVPFRECSHGMECHHERIILPHG